MSELKPCPFCGSKAKTHPVHANLIGCPDLACAAGAKYIGRYTWNTRPLEDAKDAEIAKLKSQELSSRVWKKRVDEAAEIVEKQQAEIERLKIQSRADIDCRDNLLQSKDNEIERLKEALVGKTVWCEIGNREIILMLPEEQNIQQQKEIARLKEALEHKSKVLDIVLEKLHEQQEQIKRLKLFEEYSYYVGTEITLGLTPLKCSAWIDSFKESEK